MSQQRRGNPDLRRAVTAPAPSNEALEARLRDWVSPGTFASLKTVQDKGRHLRDRVLTLPVMAAIVLSLVSRQISGLSEALRVLEQEGLLWAEAQAVSKQALSDRLRTLPASLFAQLFEQVLARRQAQPRTEVEVLPAHWQTVQQQFGVVWCADGSTLESLAKKLATLEQHASGLGGKMMMVVEAFSRCPVAAWYSVDAYAHDQRWNDCLLERLPQGGLLLFDLGFFNFAWFDAFTQANKYFLTRWKQKTAGKVLRVLRQGPRYRDELLVLGVYRSNPCSYPLRRVSVQWGTTWHTYLTNVLDPERLSAQQVCDLYAQRWRIEEAFLLTKRLLGLAYLWVGGSNGVQIQLYATWIFYAVLMDLCADVAVALRQPLERISVEMVFRSLYHFSRARQQGRAEALLPFLVQFHHSFGLVKAQRQRQRRRQAQALDIWAETLS
ncbi:MAG: IS4 family transposase [Verrucomicrobia bacterium]|nr:IS4 family transposase [Leptolyngbya sp. ES-bin-22]